MSDTRRPKPAKAAAKRSSDRWSPAFERGEARRIDFCNRSTSDDRRTSIILEEGEPSYAVRPANIGVGDPFKRSVMKIASNNRMPAIVDPDGPGGKPISIFESGAILQCLGRKTGRFYTVAKRSGVEVDQWQFWQMVGLGPITGQAHHFRQCAQNKTPYATDQSADEVSRPHGATLMRRKDRYCLTGSCAVARTRLAGSGSYLTKIRTSNLTIFHSRRIGLSGFTPVWPSGGGLPRGVRVRRGFIGDKFEEAERAGKVSFGQRTQ